VEATIKDKSDTRSRERARDGAKPACKPPVVAAPTETDWQKRADDLLARSHFPSDLMQLGELLAAENKTGKAALSRIVREIYEPLVELQDELDDDALRHGLRAALTAGAPNWRYVRKAAQGWRSNGSRSSAPDTNSYANELTDYDRDFLTYTDR
jgi:hypothetical protein